MKFSQKFSIFKLILSIFLLGAAAQADEVFGQIELNPYGTAPLSALIKLNSSEISSIDVQILPKPGGVKIAYTVREQSLLELGGVPIFGLYSAYENQILLRAKICSQGVCSYKSEQFRLKTPAINFTASAKHDAPNTQLVAVSGPSSSYAIDCNGELRWLLNLPGRLVQANSGDLWLLNENRLLKISPLGEKIAQVYLRKRPTAVHLRSNSEIFYAADFCTSSACEPAAFAVFGGKYKRIVASKIFEPFGVEFSQNLSAENLSAENLSAENLNAENLSAENLSANAYEITSIAGDEDGSMIIAMPKIGAIAKVANLRLQWIFGAPKNWPLQLARKNLRVQDSAGKRLNCKDLGCFNDDNQLAFSYAQNVRSLAILGRKNGLLYLGLFEAKDADGIGVLRLFEVDELRLSAREIFSKNFAATRANVGGNLDAISVFLPQSGRYFNFAYSPQKPQLQEFAKNTIDFELDYSRKKSAIKLPSSQLEILHSPDGSRADFACVLEPNISF